MILNFLLSTIISYRYIIYRLKYRASESSTWNYKPVAFGSGKSTKHQHSEALSILRLSRPSSKPTISVCPSISAQETRQTERERERASLRLATYSTSLSVSAALGRPGASSRQRAGQSWPLPQPRVQCASSRLRDVGTPPRHDGLADETRDPARGPPAGPSSRDLAG